MNFEKQSLVIAIALSLICGFAVADDDDDDDDRKKRKKAPKWKRADAALQVQIDELKETDADLQAQIDTIELIPGPPGPQGPQGPQGEPGDDAPDHTVQLCQLYQVMIESDLFASLEMPDFCDPISPKYVFVTSQTYQGNLGGVDGASAKCQTLAESATPALPGVYKAWLATSPEDAPAAVFTRPVNGYILTDGTVIASDWDDLTDGTLDAPIGLDESGTPVSYPDTVWSNVRTDGVNAYDRADNAKKLCYGYTSNAGSTSSNLGFTTQTNGLWTNWPADWCNVNRRLYCFQQ